ncbi:DUF1206 domain-containing protein [Microlunatus sp. Gsoil 973]|uniref:DUF1206 domain-containing protein n=1 Tax=Microlunatus sp. Gsoil 973 TaxID=2672569 RepID=UPI0012B44618|nr:DUF1206 domain-containing protein [Microlunatus sp. Gsoil 973]QGN34040.1 DUF1206 domain-containing protein [Microlunatus sp. Gsoil 973]
MHTTGSDAGASAKRAAAEAGNSRIVGILISLGLISFGLVHLAVTWLALQLAWGHSSAKPNQQGAIAELSHTPVGPVLLWILAIGFFTLVVWRLTLAVRGFAWMRGRKRTAKRWGSVGHAVVYGFLGVICLRFALGSGSSGSSGRGVTGRLINNTAGQILLLAVAAAVFGIGVHQVVKGIRTTFRDELQDRGGPVLVTFGQIGYIAKGIAVMIIGVMIAWATVSHHPGKAGGLDVAFRTIKDQPFGPVLLTALAVGIGCFGLYCFGWARRHRTS